MYGQRTLREMMAQVQRSLADFAVPLGEIQLELEKAHRDIQQSYAWPWNYAETNILVPASYTTGTITVLNGSATVTGSGTAWTSLPLSTAPYPATVPPTVVWEGWRMRFGQSNLDYIVQSVDSDTTITLAQPVNMASDLTDVTYTLYKDTYEMPIDFMPGKDIGIMNNVLRLRIEHLPRIKFEERMVVLKALFTNLTMFYTDHEFNYTTKRYQIRFAPPISQVGEYRLIYHKSPAPLADWNQYSTLPGGFDEAIELTASARLKMRYRVQGAAEEQALATGKLRLLKKQTDVAIITNFPTAIGLGDSSMNQGGMMINPWGGT